MPTEDIQSLHRKLDELFRIQREQGTKIDCVSKAQSELNAQFQQAKGAVSFVKWAIGISLGFGTLMTMIWSALKGRP